MNRIIIDRYKINNSNFRKCFLLSRFESGNDIDSVAQNHVIVFLLKGTIRISIEKKPPVVVKAPAVYLIPKGKYYERRTLTFADIIILPFNSHLDIFHVPIDSLHNSTMKLPVETNVIFESPYVLRIDPIIMKYLDLLKESYNIGFREEEFFELKIKELMLLWAKRYSKEERMTFFNPILNSEYHFSDLVYNNYRKVKTVQELADLSCYSLSGFEKKFRRIFGVPPSKWLKERLSIAVFHEITKTTKSFKEISLDFGFSSPSHLNNFCKDLLGKTPGEIRKKTYR